MRVWRARFGVQVIAVVPDRHQAEVGGRRLERAGGGWQQAFSLPPPGGSLTYELPSIAPWLVAGQGLVLLIAAILTAPGVRRPEVRDPTRSARRAATLSETV